MSKIKKPKLKQLTTKTIKRMLAKNSLLLSFPDNWQGTAIDLLNDKKIPMDMALRILCIEGVIRDGLMHRFIAWNIAEVLYITGNNKKSDWNTICASIMFANKQISEEDLNNMRQFCTFAHVWSSPELYQSQWVLANGPADVALEASKKYKFGTKKHKAILVQSCNAAKKAQKNKLIAMLKGESDFTLSDLLNNYPIERN